MSGANSFDIDAVLEKPDDMATHIADEFMYWESLKSGARDRWKETTQYVYATSTRETTNSQNEWSHSTHVPKITQIHDNLIANYMSALFPHPAWLKFEGKDQAAETITKRAAVEAYITHKHNQNNFRNVVLKLVSDWVLYGNCFARVYYNRESFKDPVTNELRGGYEGPVVERISPLDINFNPLATDFKSSPKIIRTLKTMGELERDVQDNPEMGYLQEILDKMKNERQRIADVSRSDFDKSVQLSFDGFGTAYDYYRSGFVELLELYGDVYDKTTQTFKKNRVVTVCDKRWVIRDIQNSTWFGYPHIYHCGWRIRPDNIWAMGPLDNLVGMQYLIDHLENARADAFDQMILPTRIIKGDVNKNGVVPGKPGGEYHIPLMEGDVQNLAPDVAVLNADNQIALKERMMEEYAGSPREAMGIRTPGEKTAFEVQTLATAAGRIFQNKIEYFESQFIAPLVNAEVEVARRNLDGPENVRVVDDDIGVAEFKEITAKDLSANGTLIPRGASHYAREAMLVQNLQAFQNMCITDPSMGAHVPGEKLALTWIELLRMSKFDLYNRFGRVVEQAEAQSMVNAGQQQVMEQEMAQLPPEMQKEVLNANLSTEQA